MSRLYAPFSGFTMNVFLIFLSILISAFSGSALAGDVYLSGGYGVSRAADDYDHDGSNVEVGYLFDSKFTLSGSLSFLNSSDSHWPYEPDEIKGVSAGSFKVGRQFDFGNNTINIGAGVANYEIERRGIESTSENGLALSLGYRYNFSSDFGLGVQYNYFGSDEENFSQLMMSVTFF